MTCRRGGFERQSTWKALAGLAMFMLAGCSSVPSTEIGQPTTARPLERRITSHPTNGSIFYSQGSMATLFEDTRPRDVGDILTVQIAENTNATRNLNTTAERKAGQTTAVGAVTGTLANLLLPKSLLTPNVTSTTDSSLQGQGQTAAIDVFTGTITVTVVGVLPNGYLQISGEKLVALDGNKEYLRLSGVVNPTAIDATNTVSSTQVADARIEYKGTGTFHDVQEMGWLQRLFLSISPF